jgi:uncharacterized RDD family membrane protein YckC
VTETTPPGPPRPPAPGMHPPIPGQPVPPGYYPPPPAGYHPPPRGWVPVPLGPGGRPLANFGDRLVAYIVDTVFMALVGLIFTVPLLIWWFTRFADQMTTFTDSADPNGEVPPDAFGRFFGELFGGYLVLFGVSVLAGILVSYLYLVEMTWRSGQTFGKRMMKLQIVPADPGEQPSRAMFVRRWVVERVVGGIVPFFIWVDGLWQLGDRPLQQCLHDKAAHTVVVKIG